MSRYLTVIVILLSSCASLQAPAGPPYSALDTNASLTTSLTAVEGRPGGVVLRIQSTQPRAVSVELYRVADDGEPQRLQAIRMDGPLAESLQQGVELGDGTVVAHQRLTYQLLAIGADDEVVERSQAIEVAWQPPPGPPLELVASAPFENAVELTWQPVAGLGVVVFRRDVLTEGGFERVVNLRGPATSWVDREVEASGVWSYRVAFTVVHDSGFTQFGSPSEEVYASTPEPQ